VNLSNNFTLAQLTASETAIRRGIANDPTPEQIANLVDLAATLERVQELVGPIHINSAFRSLKLNSVIGGSVTSAHLDGYACDFTAPGFGTPLEVCQAIAGAGIPYDQLIEEGHWCHISVRPPLRQEVMTAHFDAGKVTYTVGLGSQPEVA
jgi:hypothetical protein